MRVRVRNDVAPTVASRRQPPARALTHEEQTRASALFGHDFSSVHVCDRSDLRDADAVTVGSRIHLRSELPPEPRRWTLGHELAHVVQQSPARAQRPVAGAAALEREADRAGHDFAAGRAVMVKSRAPAESPQRTPITVGSRTFEVGDVLLDAAASTDIRTHGNLLPSADQAHIVVHGNQLGYEPSYTTPEDPFRWGQLKSIIDSDHIDIHAVSNTTPIPSDIVVPPGGPTRNPSPPNLALLSAGGFTLLTLTHGQASQPGRRVYVVSPNPARDQIYYATGPAGRGALFGTNSLAHELFGHYGLARVGAPSGHGQTIPATNPPSATRVRDPFGQPYAGTVDDYIANFAGATGGIFQSPTQSVGTQHLATALADLQANGAAGLRGTRGTGLTSPWSVTTAFDAIWIKISTNYRVLTQARVPPSSGTTASTIPTPASIETTVLTWYRGLTPDQKWVFRNYISSLTSSFTATRPRELASAIEPRL